ncbi:DUF3131 domain-containing protein [Ferrimonas sp. YFM]|uniref:DUF3131 domain-containing protein n=1 Tax=Ferrimonas sp. YFM TaxID=3028878 RepID=UPI0025732F49|nr:DUF3131 domain-containing protein [Ferrimonas sp. YFM]BDY06790.1 hypothetical protein F0521_38310 [Ferrimonas sp. YFM]
MRTLTCLLLVLALPAMATEDPPMRLGSKAQASEQVPPPSGEGDTLRFPAPQLSQDAPAASVLTQPMASLTLPREHGTTPMKPGRFVRILPQHLEMARAAWTYFESQYQPDTGLVNSVRGYRETTLWDVASAIAGTLAARELGLIEETVFLTRINALLHTLASMPLYDDALPARRYHTDTGLPVTNDHNHQINGSGWSALDIARTLGWLAILKQRRPDLAAAIQRITQRWALTRLVSQGQVTGARYTARGERHYQEGRLGYEQYAAAALTLWGLAPDQAWAPSFRERVVLEKGSLWADRRDRPFLTSDPFYLWQLELGTNPGQFRPLSDAVFDAHKRQFQRTGQAHCFGEDAADRAPWFLYNNLHYQGKPWLATDHQGQAQAFSQILSTKCALAWGALSQDTLGSELWQQGTSMMRSRGWLTGRYDDGTLNTSLNLNTNGVVLTVLLYIHNGNRPLLETDHLDSTRLLDQ